MSAVELPPLAYRPDEAHERDLHFWAAGWGAAVDYYYPLLVRANDTADRLYRRAFPTPKPVMDRRIGEAVEAAFFEGADA